MRCPLAERVGLSKTQQTRACEALGFNVATLAVVGAQFNMTQPVKVRDSSKGSGRLHADSDHCIRQLPRSHRPHDTNVVMGRQATHCRR
jgi:hypothetical protein